MFYNIVLAFTLLLLNGCANNSSEFMENGVSIYKKYENVNYQGEDYKVYTFKKDLPFKETEPLFETGKGLTWYMKMRPGIMFATPTIIIAYSQFRNEYKFNDCVILKLEVNSSNKKTNVWNINAAKRRPSRYRMLDEIMSDALDAGVCTQDHDFCLEDEQFVLLAGAQNIKYQLQYRDKTIAGELPFQAITRFKKFYQSHNNLLQSAFM